LRSKAGNPELREFLKCGLLGHEYVVTQSVRSLQHADADAGEKRPECPLHQRP
jgi:hypothetical protein